MSTQLAWSTSVDLLSQDLAQKFTDNIVKICGSDVYTFMTENSDKTWKVVVSYDENHSNTSASRICEELEAMLDRSLAEDAKRRAAHVQCEIHGERQDYWQGPDAALEEARHYATQLRDSLRALSDDEAKEVLEILMKPEGK